VLGSRHNRRGALDYDRLAMRGRPPRKIANKQYGNDDQQYYDESTPHRRLVGFIVIRAQVRLTPNCNKRLASAFPCADFISLLPSAERARNWTAPPQADR